MSNRIDELKKFAMQNIVKLYSDESELWKLANAKRENSAHDYNEGKVQKAHERSLDFEIEQAGVVSEMFVNQTHGH